MESEKPNYMVTRIPLEYEQSLYRLVQRAWRDRKQREKMASRNPGGEKHPEVAIISSWFIYS